MVKNKEIKPVEDEESEPLYLLLLVQFRERKVFGRNWKEMLSPSRVWNSAAGSQWIIVCLVGRPGASWK